MTTNPTSRGAEPSPRQAHRFRAGQWVEVRSAGEIAATLDKAGKLDGVPFMPEMADFCGRRLRVHRRADKVCVEGFGFRRLQSTVLLDGARCDGVFHDGCQRGCLTFWKEDWLKPADGRAVPSTLDPTRASLRTLPVTDLDGRYSCQSTELATASQPLPVVDLGLLLKELLEGELSLRRFAEICWRGVRNKARKLVGLSGLGELRGQSGKKPPIRLDLRPGEWVRVKSAEALQSTLGPDAKTRGLTFEPEMTRHIGRTFQVERRVEKIIHEETGRMVPLKGTVALRDVICEGRCMKNCPRANPLYWREDWLERVPVEERPASV